MTGALCITRVINSLNFLSAILLIDPPLIIFYTFLIVIDRAVYNHDRAIIISVEFPAALLKKGKITENWNLEKIKSFSMAKHKIDIEVFRHAQSNHIPFLC